MLRNVKMEEISDGKLYDSSDMVKAGCKGCGGCCQGMGESIVLDPYDVHRLCRGLGVDFSDLMKEKIEFDLVDGMILPHLQMKISDDRCVFLNDNNRCEIHAFRPGICRLFPLGRKYQDGGFKYFLQTGECHQPSLSKVKIRKWLDQPGLPVYEAYINRWHDFLKRIAAAMEADGNDQNRKEMTLYLLHKFFMEPYPDDFYGEFENRIQSILSMISKN